MTRRPTIAMQARRAPRNTAMLADLEEQRDRISP
jgi:hypothetical protein